MLDSAQKDINDTIHLLERASSPVCSAWVSANAGAGKTKLLVDRVLRLLLSGAPPGRILCITYTQAASAEMRKRIVLKLAAWVAMSEEELDNALLALHVTPQGGMRERARTLFAQVLEAPDGLKILTIHAFCQSLLRKFPLEAGIKPYFEVLDESSAHGLLRESLLRLLTSVDAKNDADVAEALGRFALALGEQRLRAWLFALIGQRRKFAECFAPLEYRPHLENIIADWLRLSPHEDEAAILASFEQESAAFVTDARAAYALLEQSEKATDREMARALTLRLQKPGGEPWRMDTLMGYAKGFFTTKGTPRAKLTTKNALPENLQAKLLAEQERLCAALEKLSALQLYNFNKAMLAVAEGMLEVYAASKRFSAKLDYDDLVLIVRAMLSRADAAQWVLYKLDGGIDHILLDEAQDTSREQWEIVQALTEEFFAGTGRSEAVRTLFVVGDPKQSIYSFQGAEPALFYAMRERYRNRLTQGGYAYVEVELATSYRSVAPVLESVDKLFAASALRAGIFAETASIHHALARIGHGGMVELWPLITEEKAEGRLSWELPLERRVRISAMQRMAERVVDQIAHWLESGEILASHGRAIEPGDILILVRRRNRLVDRMVRLFKRRGIPVSGIDRMVLTDNLAVQDMLALLHFLLLPQDDLNLAGLMKSPLLNISEEQLFALAHGRGKTSLWERLRAHGDTHPAFAEACAFLEALLSRVDYLGPYALLLYALDELGGRRRILGRMGQEYAEPLEEMLAQAMLYEQTHTPSVEGFVDWFERNPATIKRDLEQASGMVRIMTVHGAKGLQAPIVILPDTVQPPRAGRMLHGLKKGNITIPLMLPALTPMPQAALDLKAQAAEAELHEYYRLLYVAMTRAEDRLYIGGYAAGAKEVPHSWYAVAKGELEGMADAVETPEGTVLRISAEHSATTRPSRIRPVRSEEEQALPEWAGRRALPETSLGWRTATGDGEGKSAARDSQAALRGTLIHALLQHLPDIAEDLRARAAERFLARHAAAFDAHTHALMVKEALCVLENPEMAALFGPGSFAELPLVGRIDDSGEIWTGQVDRLAVFADRVVIVDIKTDRNSPQTVQQIPPFYLHQLGIYRALISRLYPGKTVECAIVWTVDCKRMFIPASLLDGQAIDLRPAAT